MNTRTLMAGLSVALLIMVGCASQSQPAPAKTTPHSASATPVPTITPLPTPTPVTPPQPTTETQAVQDLIQTWRTAGLDASASYQTGETTVQWTSLRIPLPGIAAQAEALAREVTLFAKQAETPLQLLLSTKTRKDDQRLSLIIRQAAQKSGGKNKVKLDHVIDAKTPAMIQLKLQEAK